MCCIFENIQNYKMNLVIDVGNTRCKAAVFERDILVSFTEFDKGKILSEIKKKIKKFSFDEILISNVASIPKNKLEKLQKLSNFKFLSSKTNVPFINLYKTPQTLGVDRIALISNAVIKYPNKNVLVIDAGSCITYDFVNVSKEYLGGAISPGIQMRLKSLNKFTANLPLQEKELLVDYIGKNTKESINSGVVNGVLREIEGVIEQYKSKYLHLTIVLTGGDTIFLSKQLKSSIFANQNFLLEGLNEILIFNKNK